MMRFSRSLSLVVVATVVMAVFAPVVDFAFLNWDDYAVIVDNESLGWPAVLKWAFATTYMEHYQPFSWLIWSWTAAAGLEPRAFHALNLVAHAAAVVLVVVTARQLFGRMLPGLSASWRDGAALAAGAAFGLHPLRVEVVAWVSAMPYTVALVLALASATVWLRSERSNGIGGFVGAVLLFVASLMVRPAAIGLPVVFVALDRWMFRRDMRRSLNRALPFAMVALAAGAAEAIARTPGLAEVPLPYRLQLAATSPFVYLWRTAVPVALSPLDVLPLSPDGSVTLTAAAVASLAGVSTLAWRWRHEKPGFWLAWVSYLALLAPAAGLVPSGLQATADRYTYLPGVVVAIAAAAAAASWAGHLSMRQKVVACAATLALGAEIVATRALLPVWRDSVNLWTHVSTVDPGNDVGLYNLGSALAAAGRPDEARERYRQALAANPDHREARSNLDRLEAARLEEEGNVLAGRGQLAEAANRYGQAVQLDPRRTHSHAARGMALAALGRVAEARAHLEEARRQGNTEAEVANTLGVILADAGETRQARAVFESALAVHQNNGGLALNLAQVLISAPRDAGGDPALALRLATAVERQTGGRDPRIVATVAAALAANGRLGDAQATNARAAELARQQGNEELAVQITARGRAYRNPGQ